MSSRGIDRRYGSLLYRARNLSDDAKLLTAPLLLNEAHEWETTKNRILYIGQETRDWGWYEDNNPRAVTLGECSTHPNALELLLESYVRFDFGRYYPKLSSAPFWRFYRRLESIDGCSVLWTNLIRTAGTIDHNSHSFLNFSSELKSEILDWQRGLLLAEIQYWNPTHCVFVTGPDYDEYIIDAFEGTKFTEVAKNFSARQAARIQTQSTSIPMIRVYHPGAANRMKLFDALFAETQSFIDQNAA